MYYCRRKNDDVSLLRGEFLVTVSSVGWSTWGKILEAYPFSSKEEVDKAIKLGGERIWASDVDTVFIHPLNIV